MCVLLRVSLYMLSVLLLKKRERSGVEGAKVPSSTILRRQYAIIGDSQAACIHMYLIRAVDQWRNYKVCNRQKHHQILL